MSNVVGIYDKQRKEILSTIIESLEVIEEDLGNMGGVVTVLIDCYREMEQMGYPQGPALDDVIHTIIPSGDFLYESSMSELLVDIGCTDGEPILYALASHIEAPVGFDGYFDWERFLEAWEVALENPENQHHYPAYCFLKRLGEREFVTIESKRSFDSIELLLNNMSTVVQVTCADPRLLPKLTDEDNNQCQKRSTLPGWAHVRPQPGS